jgi:hypothetical protein
MKHSSSIIWIVKEVKDRCLKMLVGLDRESEMDLVREQSFARDARQFRDVIEATFHFGSNKAGRRGRTRRTEFPSPIPLSRFPPGEARSED